MELEKQVVSLELAKKLKELGVKQESYFEYRLFDYGWSLPIKRGDIPKRLGAAYVGQDDVAAFTVAELGELLPLMTWTQQQKPMPTPEQPNWYCLTTLPDSKTGHSTNAHTEADARAKMLIYLIENKLVDPISSNER